MMRHSESRMLWSRNRTDGGRHRILGFQPPFSNGMNAALVLGQSNFSGFAPATTQNGMNGPSGVASDAARNIFECESGNNRCLQFRPPFSNGMNAIVVIGQIDFTSNGTALSQSGLNFPFVGAAVNGGNFFVSGQQQPTGAGVHAPIHQRDERNLGNRRARLHH